MPLRREYRFDHMRAALLFLVVFGHFLELLPEGGRALCRTIYSFHIPALLFLSGRFAKRSGRRLWQMLFLYLVFQTLYRLFDRFVMGNPQDLTVCLLIPYWLLWYLPVLMGCLALTPLLEKIPSRFRFLPFAASLFAALLWGFLPVSGYWFSFGRFLSFFPFFLAGLYLKRLPLPSGRLRLILLSAALLAAALGTRYLFFHPELPTGLLYGSMNFAALNATLRQKALVFLLAAVWVVLLLLLPWPNRRLPLWSALGKNTLPIFLLHGFFVKLAAKFHIFSFSKYGNLLLALILSLLLLLLLGNPYVADGMNRLFFRPRTAPLSEKQQISGISEKKD